MLNSQAINLSVSISRVHVVQVDGERSCDDDRSEEEDEAGGKGERSAPSARRREDGDLT